MARQSFAGNYGGGKSGSWSLSRGDSRGGMAGAVSRWLGAVDLLPEFHSRLMTVQIECRDWRKILATYDGPGTFFYLDPPYVLGSRSEGGYDHELTDADLRDLIEAALRDLIEAALRLKGKVLVSGYAHPIYDPLVRPGWSRIDWPVACHTADSKGPPVRIAAGVALAKPQRVETVWANYPIRPAGM